MTDRMARLAPTLSIDGDLLTRVLMRFLHDEITRTGMTNAILGLSGGVDSAVVAALCARALGPEHVLGIMMPYKASSPESVADANAIAASLGIRTMLKPITPAVDAYFAEDQEANDARRGNKMARERMTVLYDLSAATSSLVIGTSNKTELLLGYGTIYGDMASALNPIGDLYKTQVWALAEYLQLPESVITKAPSADLWANQSDESELGFSYYDVDPLLFEIVEKRAQLKDLRESYNPEFVERVVSLIRRSQFKRRPPLIAKVSARTIERDIRWPRDWGM